MGEREKNTTNNRTEGRKNKQNTKIMEPKFQIEMGEQTKKGH